MASHYTTCWNPFSSKLPLKKAIAAMAPFNAAAGKRKLREVCVAIFFEGLPMLGV
jgi:hypothetical protein